MNWFRFNDGTLLNLNNVVSIKTRQIGKAPPIKYEITFHTVDGSIYVAETYCMSDFDEVLKQLMGKVSPTKIKTRIERK